MLKKLFRPKWQHANPEIRKVAVSKLAHDETTILQEIALHDNDTGIRQQAISKIEDLPLLEQLITQAQTTHDKEFALKCWVAVLTQGEQLNAVSAENLVLDCKNERLLGGIIAYCDNNSLRELAFSGITDESQLLSLMKNTKNARIWQACIEKLHSENIIKEAYTIINGRDKKSQHAIKEKLDIIKSGQQLKLSQEKQANHILEKLEHLLNSEFDPLYEGILLTSKQQWHALQEYITAEKAQTIESFIAQCEERLKKNRQEKEIIHNTQLQSVQDEAAHDLLTDQLYKLKKNALSIDSDTSLLMEEKSAIIKKWNEVTILPDSKHQRIFNNLVSDISNIIEAKTVISKKNPASILTPENHSNLSINDIHKSILDLQRITSLLAKANTDQAADFPLYIKKLLATAMQYQNEIEQKSKVLNKSIQDKLKDIEILIEKKDLHNAQKKFTEIRKSLTQIPDHEGKIYSNTLQRIFMSIKTLEDWKNFANDEKRRELCQQMKNLTGSSHDPLTVSEMIKELQQSWKNLGNCPNQELWEQFKAYADEAYLPCHAYFNEQKKMRAFNAEQRETICQQLETFLHERDWSLADWKAIDKLHKSIHDEWNKYSPVERHQHQALQDRFFSSSNILKEKINAERAKNTAILTELIHRAEKLADTEDMQSAIDAYNQLQTEWKAVGITFHKKQPEQWQSFKKAGDALYTKRQNLRKDADHERQENLTQAQTICSEITRITQLDDAEQANSRALFEKLKSDFHALGALPKENLKHCQQSFHKACEDFEFNYQNIHQREWSRQLEKLCLVGDLVLTEEINGRDLSSILANNLLPDKWLKKLQARFQPQTPASNEEYARTLCIEMELLAGIAIPSEDTQLKMRWQMNLLANKFGQLHLQSEHEKIEDLYLRWFAQKCWNESSYRQLQQRFLSAAKSLPSR